MSRNSWLVWEYVRYCIMALGDCSNSVRLLIHNIQLWESTIHPQLRIMLESQLVCYGHSPALISFVMKVNHFQMYSQLRLSVIVGSGYKEQYWQVKDRWKMNHFEKETPQELENFGIDSRQFGDSIVSIPLVNFTKHTLFLTLSLNR